jgi:aryl-alcohol dehydrogenase-like predicted oxidoreductase
MSLIKEPTKKLALGTAEIEGKSVDRQVFFDLVHSAIESGVTAFDTASNYQDGKAHRWLADALAYYSEWIDPKFLLSDVVVITKVGQLSNTEWQRRRLDDENAYYYDFSEAFLEQQLESVSDAFDNVGQLIVLLHNPEDDSRLHGTGEFIRLAHMLESWSQRGAFHGWGLSSWWGLFSCDGLPAKFQLSDIAGDFGAEPFQFFKVIQVPFGLWNAEQVFLPAQSVGSGDRNADVFEAARHYGITVYVNSCFMGGHRLPEYSDDSDERILAPVDVVQLCSTMVPEAIRILGASRPETIKATINRLLG